VPSSGSGTMTPITSGAAIGLQIAQPLPYTLLSIHRYAKIMGISPLHFARGGTPGLNPIIFPDHGCNDTWFKYDWQDADKVSWWQLVHEISAAEQEIANIVGYWPAPLWFAEETRMYERPGMREYHGDGYGLRGVDKGVKTRYGKIVEAGRRAVTLIGSATVGGGSLTYTDEDGDGFFETATVTLATTITDPRQIKMYFSGKDGEIDWEVRPLRSLTISGGFVTAILDSWLLIDPELYEEYPSSDGIEAIDVSTTANFVTTVDLYREYSDPSQASTQLVWESSCEVCGGTGCAVCTAATQDGCLGIRDYNLGIVIPKPASYDAVEGEWEYAILDRYYEPDIVRLWYKAGDLDQAYVKNKSIDPLSNFWAQVIAWMATARLDRPLCGCANVKSKVDDLQKDLSTTTREMGRFFSPDVLGCPFGPRKGEVMAWRRIKYLVKDKVPSYALV